MSARNNMGAILSSIGHRGNTEITSGNHVLDKIFSEKGGLINILFPFVGASFSFLHKLVQINMRFLGEVIPGLFSPSQTPLENLGILKGLGGGGRGGGG